MKNIHILSTDQPSRLWVNNLLQGKLELSEETLIGSLRNRYIYITSDEEIKEGDWFLNRINDVFVLKVQEPEKFYDPIGEKIILTTDPTLIADGVQAIDDEFLEWFVKNSSCKFVEVINDTYTVGEMSKLPLGTRNHKYKLIIPQEEPKQYPMGGFAPGNYWHKECVTCKKEFMGDKRAVQCESCAIELTKQFTQKEHKRKIDTCHNFDIEIGCVQDKCRCEEEEPKYQCTRPDDNTCDYCDNKESKAILEEAKQETLKDIAINYSSYNEQINKAVQEAVIFGAEWQAERMYSEEDMAEAFIACWKANIPDGIECKVSFNEWFEQFKKK